MNERYKELEQISFENHAAALSVLGVTPSPFGKLPHRSLPDGASLLVRMHKVSDMCVRELRNLVEDKSVKER
jgi:hypothetical protein